MEKRQQQEKGDSTKRKPIKPAHRGQDRQGGEDFREELKQRSKAINIVSLEERLSSKSAAGKPSPRQQDFRHLLTRRQTDHSTVEPNAAAAATSSTRSTAVNNQGRQQHQHQYGGVLFPQHQDRSRGVRDEGTLPEFVGGRGDQSPWNEEGVQSSNGLSSPMARQGRPTQHRQVGGHGRVNVHHQELEERDFNYDYETQF